MGSTGSGRISDYPGSSPTHPGGGGSDNDGPGGGSPGGGGGPGDSDRCSRALSSTLEDVEQSEYYQKYRSLPPANTELKIVLRKRIVAETMTGESVGNLPTQNNFLASCMKDGWSYYGVVTSISDTPPAATVTVDFAATKA